jgi:hypothetical protein
VLARKSSIIRNFLPILTFFLRKGVVTFLAHNCAKMITQLYTYVTIAIVLALIIILDFSLELCSILATGDI